MTEGKEEVSTHNSDDDKTISNTRKHLELRKLYNRSKMGTEKKKLLRKKIWR